MEQHLRMDVVKIGCVCCPPYFSRKHWDTSLYINGEVKHRESSEEAKREPLLIIQFPVLAKF
jgi:hypothetical protein